MATEYNHISKMVSEISKLNLLSVEVGIVNGNDFLSMIAWVNDTGATISAKNGGYLMIPYKQNGELKFAKKKSVRIPARPFLERTIIANNSSWNNYFADLMHEQLENGNINANKLLMQIGRRIKTDMQKQIKGYIRPHNAPLTVANKGKDDTLIDTGKLLNSIDYRVV